MISADSSCDSLHISVFICHTSKGRKNLFLVELVGSESQNKNLSFEKSHELMCLKAPSSFREQGTETDPSPCKSASRVFPSAPPPGQVLLWCLFCREGNQNWGGPIINKSEIKIQTHAAGLLNPCFVIGFYPSWRCFCSASFLSSSSSSSYLFFLSLPLSFSFVSTFKVLFPRCKYARVQPSDKLFLFLKMILLINFSKFLLYDFTFALK